VPSGKGWWRASSNGRPGSRRADCNRRPFPLPKQWWCSAETSSALDAPPGQDGSRKHSSAQSPNLRSCGFSGRPVEVIRPLNNPDAPRTPFDLPDYSNPSISTWVQLQAEAEASTQEAKDHNQASDNYILSTVVFAAVLFFAGISTKFDSPRLRWAALFMATIGLAAATGFCLTLPLHGM